MFTPRIASVIVPAHNSASTLSAALAGLAAQDYEGDWETIVVDNGSTDSTREVARRELAGLPGGRLVEAPQRRGAGPARNAGAAAAAGDLLVFCDADDVPEPGWLEGLVRAAAGAELVAGAIGVNLLNEADAATTYRRPPVDRAPIAHGFLPFAYGGNLAIHARAFEQVGGFDEEFRFGQDVELCWRAQLAGSRIGFAADAVMQRRFREGARSMLTQHIGVGFATVHLYSRYRDAGMPRSHPGRAVLTWAALVASIPVAVVYRRFRNEWLMRLGIRIGRIAGSVRYRTFYP